jgi:hypothetical protein
MVEAGKLSARGVVPFHAGKSAAVMTFPSEVQDLNLGGMESNTFSRIKTATNLPDNDIIKRYQEFYKQFPSGGMTVQAFRQLSLSVLDETEVDEFTQNVFQMFDVDKDKTLTFEEFTMATEVHSVNSNPLEKLSWLFDHVYDKVTIIEVECPFFEKDCKD